MKKPLILLTAMLMSVACSEPETGIAIEIVNANEYHRTMAIDSLQMISPNEAFVWKKGRKMHIKVKTSITPYSY